VKEDVVPGLKTYLWIRTGEPGIHNVFCAEFCGKGHSQMITELEVLPRQGFDDWLRKRIADRYKPVDIAQAARPDSDDIRARDGDRLYKTYCASCHGAEGKGGLVAGARDFTTITGWKKGPQLAAIFRTLTDGLEGTQMRSFPQIPPWDRFALAHKVRSFYAGTDIPQDTPEELAQLSQDYELDKIQPPQERLSIEQAMKIMADEEK